MNNTTLKNVVIGIAGALVTGLVTIGAAVCDMYDNEPGKDYPMPNLKEDYHPHKNGGKRNDG